MITHDQLCGLLGLDGFKRSPRIVSCNGSYGMVVGAAKPNAYGKYREAVVHVFGKVMNGEPELTSVPLNELTILRLKDIFNDIKTPPAFRPVTAEEKRTRLNKAVERARKLNAACPIIFHEDVKYVKQELVEKLFLRWRHNNPNQVEVEIQDQGRPRQSTTNFIPMNNTTLCLLELYLDRLERTLEEETHKFEQRLHYYRII